MRLFEPARLVVPVKLQFAAIEKRQHLPRAMPQPVSRLGLNDRTTNARPVLGLVYFGADFLTLLGLDLCPLRF